MDLLKWQPRKDEDDDGIDHNVEIPAERDRPSVRFLIQVKTAEKVRPKKGGHWSITFSGSSLAKYLKSRHAVFGFKADLATKEIRWLDVIASAKAAPSARTFDLPPDRALHEGTSEVFARAVYAAIAALDDQYHPPAVALKYRAEQLEAIDSRFGVRADLVDGVERYTLEPRPGHKATITIVPSSDEDAKRIQAAVEYGSKVTVNGRLKGSPIVQRGGHVNSHLELTPKARDFRLGITAEREGHRFHIELPAETSYGIRGIEIRTADPNCPFGITVQCDRDGSTRSYTMEIDYHVWDGKLVTALPLFDKTYEFASCMGEGCKFKLDYVDYGESRTLLDGVTDKAGADFENTFHFLEILRKLRVVCMEYGVAATFKEGVEVTVDDQKSIVIAYELLGGSELPWAGMRFSVSLSEQGKEIVKHLPGVSFLANVLANVHYGGLLITSIPVQANIKEFEVLSLSESEIVLRTLPGSTIKLAPTNASQEPLE